MEGEKGGYGIMNKKEYAKYLKSEHWACFRNKIIKERIKCEKCGSDKKLGIHHLSYKNLGNEKKEDVILLCFVCHLIKEHKAKPKERKVKFIKKKKELQKNDFFSKLKKRKMTREDIEKEKLELDKRKWNGRLTYRGQKEKLHFYGLCDKEKIFNGTYYICPYCLI